MAQWETFDPPGFAVWCDKTVVLGGLLALNGQMISPSTFLDAISLIDATVWFDHIFVDSTLELMWPTFGITWPTQMDDVIIRRTLSAEELSQLRQALIETWNQRGIDLACQAYWRKLFGDQSFSLDLSDADLAVNSASDPAEFMQSAEAADRVEALALDVAGSDQRRRLEVAAFSTARALSGNLIAAQLGLFHMPSALRRGLLASFNAPCQVTDVIAIEPINDARLPSAFGRITEVAIERECALWDAVATVRHEVEPVRQSLRGSLTDPSRIRMKGVRDRLGFGKPEAQVGFGLSFAMLFGSYGRSVRSRQVEIVQKLALAAENLVEAADDFCRLALLDVPVISPILVELTGIAQRLAA